MNWTATCCSLFLLWLAFSQGSSELCTLQKVPNGRMALVKSGWVEFTCNKGFALNSPTKLIKCSELHRQFFPSCISIQNDQPTYEDYERHEDEEGGKKKSEYGDYYDYDYNELAKFGLKQPGETSKYEYDYDDDESYDQEYYNKLAKAYEDYKDEGNGDYKEDYEEGEIREADKEDMMSGAETENDRDEPNKDSITYGDDLEEKREYTEEDSHDDDEDESEDNNADNNEDAKEAESVTKEDQNEELSEETDVNDEDDYEDEKEATDESGDLLDETVGRPISETSADKSESYEDSYDESYDENKAETENKKNEYDELESEEENANTDTSYDEPIVIEDPKEENIVASNNNENDIRQVYIDYAGSGSDPADIEEPTSAASEDDEDYNYDSESSGDFDNTKATSTTEKPMLAATTSMTTPIILGDDDDDYTEGSGLPTTSTSMPTNIPTDDEDLTDGSGEGEGSGDSDELNPDEIYNFRRDFYFTNEVDLMRLDNSCKDKFISAPQIFNAKISDYNHEIKNVVIPGRFYSAVTYTCEPGFKSENYQLFCSEGEWQGKYPECVGTSSLSVTPDAEANSNNNGDVINERPSVCSEAEAAKCHHLCSVDDNEAVCKCHAGYSLDLDDEATCVDVDECLNDNGGCDHECLNEPGRMRCRCRSGYSLAGDGQSCIDDNECQLSPDICGHGDCVNLPGTYLCQCHSGFQEENGICQDIDECTASSNCPQNSQCFNLVGSFECTCPNGYQMDKATNMCADIDECLHADHGCDHICINTEGSVICECQPGYQLEENGQSCQDMDECATDNNACLHGDCINIPGSHECQCHPGFQLDASSKRCDDIDECANNNTQICGEHGQCNNLIGSFECNCDLGYEMILHHNNGCQDIDECQFNNGGCDQICVNKPGGFMCQCTQGYTLDADGKHCSDIDECINSICGQHGDCVNLPGSFSCQCHDGFQSEENGRAACRDINECIIYEHDLCGDHSQCFNLLGSFECRCDSGYQMDNTVKACVIMDECKRTENICGHGECISTFPGYECRCFDGYEFEGGQCKDIDECLTNHCGVGTCTNTQGGYSCACPKGYQFEQGTCMDVDECKSLDNGGCSHSCINMEGGHRCQCPDSHELQTDGRSCKQIEKDLPCISREKPQHGYLRCNARKIRGMGKFPAGTKCRLKCKRGFKFSSNSGPMKTVCNKDGQWSQLGDCEPKLCPQLPFLQNGLVEPPECSMLPQKGGTKCSFHCNPGYKLSGKKTISCSKRALEWKDEMPVCESDFPKPFIICPADITKPLSGRGSSVYVMIPQPKTNVDWFRYVDAEPSWAKQLEGEMTRGRHVITFRARSPMASVSSSCQMIIHVRDMEPPRVQQCPRSFTEMLSPGQSVKKITWTEPVFSDNVKIQHVMASFLPGHYFSAGKHNILYQATDADGNRGKCGFTITVLPNGGGSIGSRYSSSNNVLPAPTIVSNPAEDVAENSSICDSVPSIDSGRMVCFPYGRNGKRCTPVCNTGHQFYQKFDGHPPAYLCLPPKRVDWNIRKFIPDCSPTHELPINGRECEAGWEQRGSNKCVACPPGMYRAHNEPLCQLCPKGLYSDQFGSAKCVRCPMHHTTRGLGSRKASHCHYHRPAARSRLLDRRKDKDHEASFMYYNRWMSHHSNHDEDDIT